MLKVLIVDDEMLARVGIKSIISWQEHGYILAGEAENGQKGLEMARELQPDIIMTDVKMPVMNGIELIKCVKAEMDTKFIILSSYDDYQYVRDAMKLGAEDYILKLEMEPAGLLKVLGHVSEKIAAERSSRTEKTLMEKQIQSSISVLRERFFRDLFHGQIEDSVLSQRAEIAGLALGFGRYTCLVYHIENQEFFSEFSRSDHELLNTSVINLLEEILQNFGGGYAICLEQWLFMVILPVGTQYEEELQNVEKSTKEFLKNTFNIEAAIGRSKIYETLKEYPIAFQEAQKVLGVKDNKFTAKSIVSDEGEKVKEAVVPMEEELKALESAFKILDISMIREKFTLIEKKLSEGMNVSRKYMNGVCHTMIFIVNTFAFDNGIAPHSLWDSTQSPYEEVGSFKNQEECIIWVRKLKDRILQAVHSGEDKKSVIVKAKKYIQKHFRGNITLEQVAEQLGLSPGYFGKLFSKETAESFTDYVIRLRIESAKELLRTSNLKVYEVAEMVGYDNQHYFSRIFKKVTGLSPFDYKSEA